MKRNWIGKASFVLIMTLLLASGLQLLRQPSVASAQSGRWKVMIISTGDNGAKQLEEALNGGTWNEVKLYMPAVPAGQAIAILKH